MEKQRERPARSGEDSPTRHGVAAARRPPGSEAKGDCPVPGRPCVLDVVEAGSHGVHVDPGFTPVTGEVKQAALMDRLRLGWIRFAAFELTRPAWRWPRISPRGDRFQLPPTILQLRADRGATAAARSAQASERIGGRSRRVLRSAVWIWPRSDHEPRAHLPVRPRRAAHCPPSAIAKTLPDPVIAVDAAIRTGNPSSPGSAMRP